MEEQEPEYPFDKELIKEELPSSLDDDSDELPPSDIVAYNELRSCADLIRMHEKRQLKINPDFQREFVWKRPDQTRFIDSLIKQLPIPSMCVSYDYNTDERLVIDGLQRISTIICFLTKEDYKLSNLDDIDSNLAGKTVYEIKAKHKSLYERVENLVIPITVIRCDTKKRSHMDYLFTIFHRLNSGGAKLNNQEIRNCIYNGDFNTLLKNSVKYENYRKLMDIDDEKIYRFAFEEQNLRFFAFYDNLEKYNGKFAKFLNDYMFDGEKTKNKFTDEDIETKKRIFEKTIDLTYEKILGKKDLKGVSKAVIDALFVGVAKNIDFIEAIPVEEALTLYDKLRNDNLFSIENLKEGIAQTGKVKNRINRAIEIFAGK